MFYSLLLVRKFEFARTQPEMKTSYSTYMYTRYIFYKLIVKQSRVGTIFTEIVCNYYKKRFTKQYNIIKDQETHKNQRNSISNHEYL